MNEQNEQKEVVVLCSLLFSSNNGEQKPLPLKITTCDTKTLSLYFCLQRTLCVIAKLSDSIVIIEFYVYNWKWLKFVHKICTTFTGHFSFPVRRSRSNFRHKQTFSNKRV